MRATLMCKGEDATAFLQGQLTCDVLSLNENDSTYGAHCNPKGRVVFFFKLTKKKDGFYFDIPETMKTIAHKALQTYALFSKVTLEVSDTPLEDENNLSYVQQGIPDVFPETSGTFVAQHLNLHLIDAISFTKGCYIGQEIIARLHYLGSLKQHMYLAHTSDDTALFPGDLLYNTDKTPKGTIVRIAKEDNRQWLLFVAQDKDTEYPLATANGTHVNLSTLPYDFEEKK